MAVIYAAGVKDARMTAVRDKVDAGAGPGVLEIGTAGMAAVLVTITLADPCGTVAAGALTFSGAPWSNAAAAGGTPAEARVRDSDGNDVITGLTAGTGSEDIVLDAGTLAAGQTVTVNSGVITHG